MQGIGGDQRAVQVDLAEGATPLALTILKRPWAEGQARSPRGGLSDAALYRRKQEDDARYPLLPAMLDEAITTISFAR